VDLLTILWFGLPVSKIVPLLLFKYFSIRARALTLLSKETTDWIQSREKINERATSSSFSIIVRGLPVWRISSTRAPFAPFHGLKLRHGTREHEDQDLPN
jgi:hypothetical protein